MCVIIWTENSTGKDTVGLCTHNAYLRSGSHHTCTDVRPQKLSDGAPKCNYTPPLPSDDGHKPISLEEVKAHTNAEMRTCAYTHVLSFQHARARPWPAQELEELKTQGVQPHVLRVWVAEELRRSRNAWAPLRLPPDGSGAARAGVGPPMGARPAMDKGGANESVEEGPDLTRVVELDDIRPALLPIKVDDAHGRSG